MGNGVVDSLPRDDSRVEDLDVTARLSSVLVGGLPGSEVLGTWVLLSEGEAHYFTC